MLNTSATVDCRSSIITVWRDIAYSFLVANAYRISQKVSVMRCLIFLCLLKLLCFCFQLVKLHRESEIGECDGCYVRPVSGQKTGGRKQSPSMNSRSKVSMVKIFLWRSTGKQAADYIP